jgi:Trypsin-like peptidase domain
MDLEALKKTIARTSLLEADVGFARFGTAFLISERHLLTCRHNLRGITGELAKEIEVFFTAWPGDESQKKRLARPVWEGPSGIDLVILETELPALGVGYLRCGSFARANAQFQTWGYPLQTPLGHAATGVIRDPSAVTASGAEALQLFAQDAHDRLNGLSGAPVIVDGLVVGVISEQLKEEAGDGPSPAFDRLDAVPIAAARGAPGVEFVDDTADAPAPSGRPALYLKTLLKWELGCALPLAGLLWIVLLLFYERHRPLTHEHRVGLAVMSILVSSFVVLPATVIRYRRALPPTKSRSTRRDASNGL